ncbi:hypothetical protein KC644_00040 [Candidatus Berkelbacteria bacterium]|nr:hypothetical protein [Candidatus Berkelbacteria bacterium]
MLDGILSVPIKEWTPSLRCLKEREDDDLSNYNIKGVNYLRQTLFANICVTELANPEVRLTALKCKRKFLHELLRRTFPHKEIRDNTTWLYAGSGLDLYSPLFLGGKKIVMIDPLFRSDSAIRKLKDLAGRVILLDAKIRGIEPEVSIIDENELCFELDLGEGPVEISIRWSSSKLENYQAPKKERLGVIMGLIQPELQLDKALAMAHLEPGGYVICDWPLRSRYEGEPPREAPINKHALRERRKQFKKIYDRLGFSYIVIGQDGQILKKKKVS